MPERLLLAALLLGALWLVRRSLAPAPVRLREGAPATPRCGGCPGCGEEAARSCRDGERP